jgi:hypothetical protein
LRYFYPNYVNGMCDTVCNDVCCKYNSGAELGALLLLQCSVIIICLVKAVHC